uniref:Transcription factor domain-containing protein n=1 Tax=Bionectria ochroleuca TaxID=29856 RepID=A0A8H7K555_BIOOC
MLYEFINNNAQINPTARRRIRSHAATGKNLGKTLVRRSRKDLLGSGPRPFQVTVPERLLPPPEPHDTRAQPRQHAATTFDRQIGDGVSISSLPIDFLGESRALVHKAITFFCRMHYTPELSDAFQAHKGPPTMWFQLAFEDEAYFHIVMAISITSLNNVMAQGEDPALALQHQGRTVYLINSRLSQANPVSNANLAVVVMIAQYERLRGRFLESLVHLDGLYSMVEMRGGIATLIRDEPSLGQKIARLDLDLALYIGTKPRFDVASITNDSTSIPWLSESLITEHERGSCGFSDCPGLSIQLRSIATQIACLGRQVNDAHVGLRTALHTRSFHIVLLRLGHRLIHFAPLGGPRPTSEIDNAVQLGLIAFLMPFMHQLDGTMPHCPLLSHQIHLAMQRDFATAEHTQEVLLWILLVSGASVFSQLEDGWLVSAVSKATKTLDLCTWEELACVMDKYPWIDGIHNKPARLLCGF